MLNKENVIWHNKEKFTLLIMTLYWKKEEKYYKLFEQPTLFGTKDVVCVWGRVGGSLGGYKTILCNTEYEVQKVVEQVKKRRLYRGYIISTLNDIADLGESLSD